MNISLSETPFQNRVQVAVRTIGVFPPDKYQYYLDLLNAQAHVELSSLTFHHSQQESMFPNQHMNGEIELSFIEHDGAPWNRQWEDFQMHRRILGVICLCYLPLNQMNVAYEEYIAIKKMYPTALQFSLYAFEPSEDQLDSPEFADLVLFPNQKDRIGFYLKTFIDDIGSRFISDFEALARACDDRTILHSPLDSDKVLMDTSKHKKMWGGRREKHIGDLCLLAGSPVDANRHYTVSLDLSKSQNDWIWHAGALEGVVTALIIDERNNGSEVYLPRVVQLYDEALSFYLKKAFTFQLAVENRFRLARYLMLHNKKHESATCLLRAVEFASEASANDQAGVALECALLSFQMQSMRKFVFFIQCACNIYKELNKPHTIFNLLLSCAPVLGMHNFSPLRPPSKQQLESWHDEQVHKMNLRTQSVRCNEYWWEQCQFHPGRWVTLQKMLLEELVESSQVSQRPHTSATCIVYLIRCLYPWLDREYQKSLAADLFTMTRQLPVNTRIDMGGIPRVECIQVVPNPCLPLPGAVPALTKHTKSAARGQDLTNHPDEDDDDEDVFLFTPNRGGPSDTPNKLHIVAGETVHFQVVLSNPLQFEIVIQRIWISTDGVEFDAHPESLTLQPETDRYVLLVSGRPKESGILNIRGCYIRAFNLLHEHRVNETGQGMPGIQPQLNSKEFLKYGSTLLGDMKSALPPTPVDSRSQMTKPKPPQSIPVSSNGMFASPKPHMSLLSSPSIMSPSPKVDGTTRQLPSLYGPRPFPSPSHQSSSQKSKPPHASGSVKRKIQFESVPDSKPDSSDLTPVKPKEPQEEPLPLYLLSELQVVPALPRILVRLEFNGNMEGNLFYGETRQLSLYIQNTSSVDVSEMHMDLKEIYVQSSSHAQDHYYASDPKHAHLLLTDEEKAKEGMGMMASSAAAKRQKIRYISWNENDILHQLPLKSNSTMCIPVLLRAHPSCCGADVTITYSGTGSSRPSTNHKASNTPLSGPFHRKVSHSICWQVSEGILLKSMDIAPFVCSSQRQQENSTLSVVSDSQRPVDMCMLILEVQNTADSTFRLFCNVDSADAKRDSGKEIPVPEAIPEDIPSPVATPSSVIRHLHPLEEAAAEAERETETEAHMPRLTSTKNVSRSSSTKSMADSERGRSIGVFIEKMCNKRVVLPIPKFSFGEKADTMLRDLALSYSSSTSKISFAERRKCEENNKDFQACRNLFLSRISLSWRSSENTMGTLSLTRDVRSQLRRSLDINDTGNKPDLSPHEYLTAEKLHRLVPDEFVFQFKLNGLSTAGDESRDSITDPSIPASAPMQVRTNRIRQGDSNDKTKEEGVGSTLLHRRLNKGISISVDRTSISAPIGISVSSTSDILSPSMFAGGMFSSAIASPRATPVPSSRSPIEPTLGSSRRGSRVQAMMPNIPPSHSSQSGYAGFSALDLNNYYPVGQFKPLSIIVTNRSQKILHLDMIIKPYQDSVNGGIETNLQQKMMWIGSLSSSLPPIHPGQSYSHEITLCFISLGRFHFQVCCKPRRAEAPTKGLPSSCLPFLQFHHSTQSETQSHTDVEPRTQDPSKDLVYWCTTPLVIEAVE